MRPFAALGVTLASAAVLGAAWKVGDSGTAPRLAGVQLVTPAPLGATTTPPAGSSSSSSSPAQTARKTTKSVPAASSFTGGTAGTPFGDVQVRAVFHGTQLVDVVAVHLTDSGGHSVQISAYAAPILRQEALSARSAHINAVSGASYTSAGYIASLQSALDAARAAGV